MGDMNNRDVSKAQQASTVTSVLPSTSEYQDEQHLAHPFEQHSRVDSAATVSRASTVTQGTAALNEHVLGDTSIALDQVRRTEESRPYEYKAPADLRENVSTSVRTSASTMSVADETDQETAISLSHLRQPELGGVKQQTTTISHPSVTADSPILGEISIHLNQLQRTEAPQTVQYKAPAGITPSTGSIMTTAAALSQEEPAQETPINVTQFSQPTAQGLSSSEPTGRQTSSVTQVSATTDLPIMEESSIHLDQIQRPEAPQTVQYKAPAGIQSSTGSLTTSATTVSQEESAPETSVNITQVRQQQADASKQKAAYVAQLSLTADELIPDETAIQLRQFRRSEVPETVQYKPPADIQPSTGSLMTSAAALSQEEPAQETPMNITQFSQATAQGLSSSEPTGRQTSSVTQVNATTDLPIMEESSIHLDQIQRPEAPQTVQYKAPADIQPSTGSLMTSAAALSQEEPAQETPINITQFSQPTAQGLSPSKSKGQQASSVTQVSATTDLPIMEEGALHFGRVQRPEAPQTVQYKAPADIQPSIGSLMTSAAALSQEEPPQETSINITQYSQPTAQSLSSPEPTERQTSSVTQVSATTDLPIMEESALRLDQIQRPEAPETVQYKAPAGIQSSTGSLTTSATTGSQEEPAQEAPMNITQFSQATAQGLPSSEPTGRQTSSVTQVSATADLPIMEESSIQLDQIQRPDAPQTVQYKAPADIQPSTGSLMTSAAALSQEEPAQETSINITQFSQPTAQGLPTSESTGRKTSSVTQVSATTDLPIMEEGALHLGRVQRPEASQTVQYKAPADIQPSTGSLMTSAAALSQEEPAQETSVNITQFSQPSAKDLPPSESETRQATSITQLSAATDSPIFEETAVSLNRGQRSDAPQTVQYKAPAGIQSSTGSILISTSALGDEQLSEERPLNASQVRQATAQELPDGRQRASAVSQPFIGSDLPIFDQTALQINQIQRAHEAQAFEYQTPAGIKEATAHLHSSPSAMASGTEYDDTILTSIESYQQQQGYKAQRPSIVSDRSYAVAEDDDDHVHSTTVGQRRLMVPSVKQPLEVKDEQEEEQKQQKEDEELVQTEASTNVEDVTETLSITEQSLQTTEEQSNDVSVTQTIPADTLPMDSDQSGAALVQKIDEPLEILSSQVIDYIEIRSTEGDVNDQKPEAIIVTAETKSTEDILSTQSMSH